MESIAYGEQHNLEEYRPNNLADLRFWGHTLTVRSHWKCMVNFNLEMAASKTVWL
jgi:hypothetical protein